ncbi:MAG: serine/threonine protein kinase [Deltaproteobacteria bacterium]|nr:serine/threonine protein kinase [Deltaproteobacteria bacterium]
MSQQDSCLPEGYEVDPDLEPGEAVGEYVVDGKLGQGAFGTVFRAAHPLIGKVVAIKVLARKYSVDPEMVSRFVAEARAVNQIRDRHIIDIFSFGRLEDGRQYYVMEYLDGETLDARIEREGRVSLAQALPILRGIGRALDAAHGKGIAHRDLKAENVFLASDPDGGVWPKLLDFGIAKLMAPEPGLGHKTRTGTPVGTPYYMSPEQCRGRDVDHRTDLYAFGVLAYLVLTGKYPFDADDYLSILMQQITVQAAPASSIASDLPVGVDEVLAWLLAKDPVDRPPNLRAAVTALESVARAAGLDVPRQTGPLAGPQTGPRTAPAIMPASKLGTRPPHLASAGTPSSTVPPAKRSRVVRYVIAAGAVAVATLAIVAPWAPDRPAHALDPAVAPVLIDPPVALRPHRAPSEPQTVIVTVAGVPDGTEVIAGGMTAGAAPGPVQLPRDQVPMVLTFKLDGYLPTSRTVTPDRDQALTVTLKKKPTSAPGHRSSKDDLIDIFGKRAP